MRRRLTMLLLLFAGGVIVNVAVAWSTSVYSNETQSQGFRAADASDLNMWLRHFGSGIESPNGRWSYEGRYASLFTLGTIDASAPAPNVIDGNKPWVTIYAVGWPMRTLAARQRRGDLDWSPYIAARNLPFVSGGFARVLPAMPLWRGFALNAALYAAILGVVTWLPIASLFAVRRIRRMRRGLCPTCAYDLRGSDSPTCPECGAETSGREAHGKAAELNQC